MAKKGRGGPQSGRNVLQGGHTGGTTIWIVDLGTFGGDGNDDGGDIHQVSEAYQREAGATEGRRDVGDSQGGSIEGSGSNPVVNDLHWSKAVDGDTVGGDAANIEIVCKGYGI